MTPSPAISVIMPHFNAEKTLPLALASLLAQSFEDWECILIDDASEVSPTAILRLSNDPRIIYHRLPEHVGRGAARQAALDRSRGEFLCMLDADDWLYPDRFMKLVKFMRDHPRIDVASTGMSICGADFRLQGLRRALRGLDESVELKPIRAPRPSPIFFAPSIIRMSAARRFSYDPSFESSEDFDFLVRLLREHSAVVLPDVSYVYAEEQTINASKISARLRMNRKTFRKFLAKFPFLISWQLLKTYQKDVAYRVAYRMGMGPTLYARGLEQPSVQQNKEYADAYQTVRLKRDEIFSEEK